MGLYVIERERYENARYKAKDKGLDYVTILIIMWRFGKNGKPEVLPYPVCVYCEGKGYLKLDRNLK